MNNYDLFKPVNRRLLPASRFSSTSEPESPVSPRKSTGETTLVCRASHNILNWQTTYVFLVDNRRSQLHIQTLSCIATNT
jgi:hypothetical protein